MFFSKKKILPDGNSPVIYEWTILKEPELYIYSPYGYPKAGLIKYNWDTQTTELISETSDNCQMEYIAVGQNEMYYLSPENVPYKMTFRTRKSEILKENEDISRIYIFYDKYVLWSPNNMPLLEQ